VTRVPVDPFLCSDTNDYSLDPALAGRRVEVRVSQTELTAVCLDTGERACRHTRSFAKHRTITAIEHARTAWTATSPSCRRSRTRTRTPPRSTWGRCEAAQDWGAASMALEARSAALVSDDSPPSWALRRINRALMRQERLLTTRQGIPGRPWFRHQIYAPGINTGYAAQFLPGIRDALEAGDDATVRTYRDLLLDSLRRVTATASNAAGRSGAPLRRRRSAGSPPGRPQRPRRPHGGAPGPRRTTSRRPER
jgi:hypothetical protein